MELILFIASFCLMIISGALYLSRDDSAGARSENIIKDIRSQVDAVQKLVLELGDRHSNFSQNVTTALGDVVGRVKTLEERKQLENVNLHLFNPLQIEIVNKPVNKLVNKLVSKSKTPLLDRAGITKKKKEK